jgi:O-acetyl-ADP-ribose deacetylase (regulator of RNase III)
LNKIKQTNNVVIMVRYIKGDLFESRADALAHGCNTLGKMGAGIAREFKKRYPKMYKDYKDRCAKGEFEPGDAYIFMNESKPHIINLATQSMLGGAEIEFIDKAFYWLRENYKKYDLRSIAMPKIGSGLGKVDWQQDVEPILNKYFDNGDIVIEVYSL